MKSLKLTLLSLTMLLLSLPAVQAAETDSVLALTKGKVNEVIEVLKQKQLPKEERARKIIEIIDDIFDFQLMASLSLGKKHWSPLSKEERKEFSELFVERIKQSYLDKLDLYTDQQVVVEEANQVKNNRIEVLTYLVGGGDRMEMIYKMYKTRDGGWKVYDVDISGVSFVQTYRSQFEGVLQNQSFAELMDRMRSKEQL
ncbi:MAG: MlaC/ttg2D family ABC transporter substrate-binding protein [bacterium]|jgi:phospholipid transport system substrate-binding protein